MRALVAFDKFKYALTARAACATAANTLRDRHPDWQLDLCPLTDGGEGFCETLTDAVDGSYGSKSVAGPRDCHVVANIGYVDARRLATGARKSLLDGADDCLAIIGMASASGLELVARDKRDPWQTTTLGTGELIKVSLERNIGAILLGIGGSATNDLGLGALAALGFQFLDATGAAIPVPTPATWENIQRIDAAAAITLPPLFIACDVTNPLLGPTGATAIFGPQKGLRPADLPRLEAHATRMAALLCEACGKPLSLANTPGAGAAGGIAFGLMVATGAKLVSGFDLVSDWLDLPGRIGAADLVITGEGRFDTTSLDGKGPGSLVREAQRLGKPAYIFAGSLGVDQSDIALAGVKAHAITPTNMPLTEALPRTAEFLAREIGRVL